MGTAETKQPEIAYARIDNSIDGQINLEKEKIEQAEKESHKSAIIPQSKRTGLPYMRFVFPDDVYKK